MKSKQENHFSQKVTFFQELPLPEKVTLTGYAAIISAYNLRVPLPRQLFAIGTKHKIYTNSVWKIYTPRYTPAPNLEGHLRFALKYEGVDLAVLKCLFKTVSPKEIESIVHAEPTGSYARRIWFLYEWLIKDKLDLPNANKGTYVSVVDSDKQFVVDGKNSPRHRVRNNLPGTPDFCPLIFRTEKLDRFIKMNLPAQARKIAAEVPRDLLARTAAFLLLKDSKSSYAIEGEQAPQNRIQRWARAIGEAGKRKLSLEELLRLQRMVIGDNRFVKLGLRGQGGFIGEHDRTTRMPIPEHISAHENDLPSLIEGLIGFDREISKHCDPVLAATALAFGFVYIHPFEDGNGRIHRYLIHHVLAEGGFNPPGVVFPISSAILEEVDQYRKVLENYSARLLPYIEWEPTENSNVKVINETGDFYRFFDATPHAEFLYDCVEKTVKKDLPREVEFLSRYDDFRIKVKEIIDMPDSTVDLLFRFLQNNHGILPKRALKKEFAKLTKDEVADIQDIYKPFIL